MIVPTDSTVLADAASGDLFFVMGLRVLLQFQKYSVANNSNIDDDDDLLEENKDISVPLERQPFAELVDGLDVGFFVIPLPTMILVCHNAKTARDNCLFRTDDESKSLIDQALERKSTSYWNKDGSWSGDDYGFRILRKCAVITAGKTDTTAFVVYGPIWMPLGGCRLRDDTNTAMNQHNGNKLTAAQSTVVVK